ncbi:AT-rich interactive domain-containing protein 1B-like isoform X4 [Acanthaster planci]|uniref:AT-rich interactive domain-containing protein 1B-like isoform X4 n=1 Tax=Acanthaster planci TaxID=133434 RepID=A0A8B7XR68_ACAPL|nr:AT-rich interactive domain-containing protein 1B-like isoform X4 [Acanthaster planci]
MAAKVAGNVKCDQEINSRPQGQQATNNTMDNTVQEYRPTSHNTGGEGTNGPTDSQGTGVNNAMSSAGQPPGNSGTEIGTKTASSVGSVPGSNSAILQDGHHVGQSSMTSSHHPSQNQSLDPYAGPGGTFQNNSSMHNQLVDNSGQKTAQNMTGSEGFNGGYYGNRNAGFGMTNQHGGHQTGNGPPNSALNMNLGPNQNQNMANNPYNQYDGHLGSRQGYSPMVMGSRSGPNAPSMPPNYGSSHQQQPRPYGSDRISSSAPTLSQLLQGQKHVPNYSSNYPSPGDNMGKGLDGGGSLGMISNQGSGTFHQSPQNWGQRSSGMSQVHTQSASGANTYGPNMGRNQMGVAADSGVNSVPKRPFPSVPYQPQNQLSSRQYPGMAQSMYPGSHLAGSRSHNAQSQGSMGNNSTVFPQQMPSQYGQQGQGMEYIEQQSWQQSWQQQPPSSWQQHQQGIQSQQQMWTNSHPTSQHQPPSSSGYQQSQQPTSSYSRGGQQTTPSNNKSGSTSDEVSVANRPPSLPDLSGSLDDLPTGADFSQNNVATSSQSTDSYSQSSQSPHMHPTVSALRPSPSPVGSPASHMSRSSLSPASVPGGSLTPQPTSMPPPSSQSETSSHNQMSQSPVGQDRVFSQPMMSAASQIGTNQMPPPYGSQGTPKSHHGQQQSSHPPSAPGGSQMFPGVGVGYAGGVPVGFGPNVSQLNQQGNYQRQAGMQGLCGPPTSYPSHSTGNGGSNVFMDGRMRNTSSSSSVSSMDGFSNSQYPGYNSGNVPTNSGPGMSPSQGSTGMNSGIKSPGLGATSYGYNHPHRTTDQHSVGPASSNTSGGSSGMGSPGLGTGATGIPGASSEASIAGGSTSPGISNSTPSNLATGNKGAQAAAEAAVIAAANMASAKTAYHRTLGSQNQGRQQPQPFPPPYQQQQQQQPQQQLQQHWPQVPHNQGFPNSACPMPSSLPTSMPNSLTSPMPSSSVVNSMPNSIPSSMYGSAPGPLTNSLPCANIPGTLPLFSHANSQRNNSFMPTDSTGQVTATMANSLPGSVGTSVTPSITAPVCMPSVTASGLGNMLDTPKNSPAMSKEDARADTPQSQKTVKQSETASRPSSPPLGLLGASPLGSPGAISKSSQEESAPSPSPSLLNKLPASPANKPPKRLMKLYDLCDHPDRKPFLDAVFRLMEDRGQPIRTMPQISTHTLDLFKLYHAVKERGGVVKVSKNKQWKQIAMYLTVGSSNSAAFTLKKNYIRYLLPFECFHDRGGVDPQVIMAEIDTSKKKSSSSSANTSSSDSSHHHTPANPVLDNIPGPGPQDFHGGPRDMYQQRPHPGGKPMNQMHPFPQPMHNNIGRGMSPMPNNMMPMSNDTTSNSVTVRDPFSDADLQSSGTFQGVRPGQGSFPQGMAQNSVDGTYVAGMSQYRNNTMGAGGDAFNNMATHPPTSGHPTGEPFPSGMRNNTMPGNDPYTSGRRDSVPVPDGFNRRTTNMPGAEPFPVNNRAAGMPMSQGNTGQFPYGPPYERERFDQQRPRVAASPSQPVQQGNTGIIPPYPNNSMDQNMYSSRFSQQHSSSRPATPSDSFGSTTLPNQQKTPHATGLPADQMRQQFPQKRPGEMYGPTSKRQDMMTPTSVISRADDAYRGITSSFGQQGPYPQGAFPGDRPMTNQGGYSPGFREGRPPQGPAPAPQQGGKHELGGSGGGFMPEAYGIRDRSLPGAGPSPSWGSVQQRQPAPPYTNTSLGPHPFVSQAGPPRTLQQALMAAHRDRHPPSKMMKSSPPQIHTTSPQKKDIVFPPDSVEASQPALNKPKKKTSRDIGTIEAWKLMMALKSGLLAESTWALEVLNILLYDNNTIVYFDLGQLKGLLEILVDHYRASLIEVFGTLNDVEVRTRREVSDCGSRDFPQDCVCRSNPQSTVKYHDKSEEELIQEALNMFDVEKLRGADKKKLIRLEQNSDGFYSSEKEWDYHEGFKSNQLHWQCGGGDMTKHIVHVFESDGILKKILKRQARRRKAERAKIVKMVNKAKRMEENNHLEAEENYQSNDSMENVEDCPKADDECIKEDQEEKNEGGEDGKDEEELEENTKEEEEDQETVYNGRNDTDDDTWLQSCSEELRAAKKSSDIIALYKGDLAHPTCSPLEDEGTCNDHTALVTTTDAQRSLTQRCITISNIIRSLSFIPGNDVELSKHAGVLVVMGRILLLHHRHAERKQLPQTYDREDHDDLDTDCPITDKDTWWWHCLNCLRENTLVTLTNISGQLDLSAFVERVSLPILDGLLHWAICLSACAVDPFPTLPATSPLTPKRIAVEALSKLSIQENNVDMILATPPFHRLEKLFATLTQYLSDRKEPVMREFAIVLLSSIAQGDPSASRAIASQNSSISFLLCYLEDSEYAKSLESGSNAKQLSQNPDIQPASPDMMRRTAILLAALAKVADNKPLFLQHQHRLLNLSMSPMVTDSVKALIADALYEIS